MTTTTKCVVRCCRAGASERRMSATDPRAWGSGTGARVGTGAVRRGAVRGMYRDRLDRCRDQLGLGVGVYRCDKSR